jgi:hypothetical protein
VSGWIVALVCAAAVAAGFGVTTYIRNERDRRAWVRGLNEQVEQIRQAQPPRRDP